LIGDSRVGTAESERQVAFERLAASSLDQAYRLAAVILGSGLDAEDATHDAVVQAWRQFATLRDQARFDAWFQRILVNICRDLLRRRRRTPVTELILARAAEGGDPFDSVDARLVLDHAYARLSADQAITVVLRFHADLTLEEISARMGVPIGTVKSRLHTALGVMHRALSGPEVVDL
jgi:RNA polymerase sigma-70 factor (ECF subfamily)